MKSSGSSGFLVLLLLVAVAGQCRAEFDYRASLMDADRELQKAGLSPTSSFEDVRALLAKLVVDSDTMAQPGDADFTINYLYHVGDYQLNLCKTKYYNFIGKMKSAIDKEPASFSTPVKNYVEVSYSEITKVCLKVLSANDWAAVEDLLKLYELEREAAMVVELLDDTLDQPQDVDDDNLYARLAARVNSFHQSKQVRPEYLFNLIAYMKNIVDPLLLNLGSPMPVDKFNLRLRRLYVGGLIWDKLKATFTKDLISFFNSKTPEERKFVKDVSYLSRMVNLMEELDLGISRYADANELTTQQVVEKLQDACRTTNKKTDALLDLVGLYINRALGGTHMVRTRFVKVCADVKNIKL